MVNVSLLPQRHVSVVRTTVEIGRNVSNKCCGCGRNGDCKNCSSAHYTRTGGLLVKAAIVDSPPAARPLFGFPSVRPLNFWSMLPTMLIYVA